MKKIQTKILVVDDNAENINLLYHILTQKGHSVSGVPSGVLALDIIDKFQPDIILLDVMMPEMDGYETCMKIKAMPAFSEIPIIFVTAKTSPQDIAKGFQVGATDYITKPIKEEEVWARLEHQLKIQDLLTHKENLIQQLNDQEKRYRTIINCASNPMLTLTSRGKISSANPAALTFLEYKTDEILGKTFSEILSPEFSEQYSKEIFETDSTLICDDALNNSNSNCQREVRVFTKTGRQIPVDMSLNKLGTDFPLYLCHFHDLTVHKHQMDRLKLISHIDKLTNLANRRKFDEFFSVEWRRSQREKNSLSLLFIDIDFFKQFNDHLGHQEGDVCLQRIAKALQTQVFRPTDLVARYGGEEFVVVLPNTTKEGSIKVANDLRAAIERLAVAHTGSDVTDHVTISVGVSTVTATQDIDKQDLVSAADKALYQAKQLGRNRVEYIDCLSQ